MNIRKLDNSTAPSEEKEGPLSALPASTNEGGEKNKFQIKSDDVLHMDPDYPSFEAIQPNEWLHNADAENFENWLKAESNKNVDWILKPNADSNDDLKKMINKGEDPHGHLIFGFHQLQDGEIGFANKYGVQKVHLTSGYHTLEWRQEWGTVHKLNENYIKEGNVTIARILPGTIGLAFMNGKPVILLPGRHAYNSPLFSFDNSLRHNINDDFIKHQTITIFRVKRNELGLAWENGNPFILQPGLHIKNSATFEYTGKLNASTLTLEADSQNAAAVKQQEEKYSVQQQAGVPFKQKGTFYEHGTISIMRIEKGQTGCALIGQEPALLRPGIHIQNSRSFQFAGIVNMHEPHINFHTIHIIQIKSGQVGLAWDQNKAIFLKQGIYEISSPTFKFDGFKNISDKIITHGSITQFRVDQGELGYAYENGQAVEFPPGVHYRDDSQFLYKGIIKANEPVINFGNITHIIVKEGEARAIWKDGSLKILYAGRHHFDSPTLIVAKDAIPLQAVIKPLQEIKVTTKDRMPMHVTGQVTYRVIDPEKLVKGINQENLVSAIERCTDAILRHQVSLTDLSMINPEHHSQYEQKNDKKAPGASSETEDSRLLGNKTEMEGDNYRGKLCHNVQNKLSQDTSKWGIEIVEFAISDIGFQDKKVEESLAKATADTRQAEAQFELVRAQNATEVTKAEADAKKQLIQKQNEANIQTLKFETDAKNKIANAQADAQANYIKAEQEAKASYMKAEKEAQASVAAQNVKADAALHQAKAESDAAKARAEGQVALAKVPLAPLQDKNYFELEKLKLQVEIAKYEAQRKVPVVSFSGDGSTRAAESLFLGKGDSLVSVATRGMFAQAVNAPEKDDNKQQVLPPQASR